METPFTGTTRSAWRSLPVAAWLGVADRRAPMVNAPAALPRRPSHHTTVRAPKRHQGRQRTLADLRGMSNVLVHLPQTAQRFELIQSRCPACLAVGWVDAGGQVQWANMASRSDTLDAAARALLARGDERIGPDTMLTNGTATIFI